ncbi:regulation of apoptotic process [Desmophyllum pertusum]|uniref:Regulation of apoptotic process n=1 Tax=Desmophyllum pertusum TaxID=174260 RepID=A0A9W9ZCT1_9CNID|nr:regulation of apoptotic process [Desmophyllum pertusum]
MEKKAVSPDSSTHLAEKSKKSKKRKHKHRNKKKSKKVKSSSSSLDIESDNTKTESKNSKASNERIKHLTEFLDDRKQLHEQLFSIIPKKEVKDMMPDILKKLKFKEVKKLCSEQLESLSKRQLESIITGKELASSDNESTNEQEKLDELQPVEGILQKTECERGKKKKAG